MGVVQEKVLGGGALHGEQNVNDRIRAIWAAGTICTVEATGRGLIIGQSSAPQMQQLPPDPPQHPNQSTTHPLSLMHRLSISATQAAAQP